MNTVLLIILIVLSIVFLVWWIKHAKKLKISNVYFVSGAVKTGKSYVTVALGVKTYKRNLRRFYLTYPLLRLKLMLRHEKYDERIYKPMLYSNIPLRYVKYNPFTIDILLRKVRIPNKSVCILDEVSLLADSMLFKDKKINDDLTLFFKLYGHYTHGGTCVINSQTIADTHFAIKRSIGRYMYIYGNAKFPFFTLLKGCERIYSDDTTSVNVVDGDLEAQQKRLLFLNKYYRYYDCYCYSIFTDDLSFYVDYDYPIKRRKDSLKCNNLVSLQSFADYLNKSKRKTTKKKVSSNV